MAQPNDLLAVLIDADNVSQTRIGAVLDEIAKYGTASVKRVYGDWSKERLHGWLGAARDHVIQPVQQLENVSGKNASDIALIIDAMDLLHTGRFSGFCIVSSDSDFTRLASRIREEGVTVYGFGARTTAEAFRNACDQFTYLDLLESARQDVAPTDAAPKRMPGPKMRGDTTLVTLLRTNVSGASSDDGWANLAVVGSLMRKQQPDFDSRNWGYAKLSDLVREIGLFTIETNQGGGGVRVRDKRKA
ncbi:NYN domain-containing protein [Microbacterium thalassium]|uniref:Uncharacterized LabA/DUF88 family protein n=1 Tax=Microbacterium thalassium TaxID=362649 RepID=A0A7X0KVY0_9MICO|nr:NYN domain-containing protein [Microbacterium thalassium]MBB6392702.1 uncharacterized LabA/DUF88 family protein [Microbacterium thalassium]GLK23067.1 hypothetical protein GCM10017607_03850 [Microbacterium thalassium]